MSAPGPRFGGCVLIALSLTHAVCSMTGGKPRLYRVPLELAEANALLYAAAARAGAAMGYRTIQTYVLESEPGTSLAAAGWTDAGPAGGGQWKHTDGRPRRTDQPTERKHRWFRTLTDRPDLATAPDRATKHGAMRPALFP